MFKTTEICCRVFGLGQISTSRRVAGLLSSFLLRIFILDISKIRIKIITRTSVCPRGVYSRSVCFPECLVLMKPFRCHTWASCSIHEFLQGQSQYLLCVSPLKADSRTTVNWKEQRTHSLRLLRASAQLNKVIQITVNCARGWDICFSVPTKSFEKERETSCFL